jgi:hypothetical protein
LHRLVLMMPPLDLPTLVLSHSNLSLDPNLSLRDLINHPIFILLCIIFSATSRWLVKFPYFWMLVTC